MKQIYLFINLLVVSVFFSFSYGQKVLTLQPGPEDGIDAYLNSIYPYEAGYGNGMLVTAWTLSSYPYVGRDVLKFNLSQIPPGATILDAKLSLYYDPNGSWPEHTGTNESCIRRVTSPWDEMTVCWVTQPTVTETGKIVLPETTDPQQDFTGIDITDFVKGWVADTSANYGMMIALTHEDPYATLVLSSSDGSIPSKRPKIVITYLDCDLPAAGFTEATNGLTISFTDASLHAQSWSWDFGDGSGSTLQNPVHTYPSKGTYYVCLTAGDSCGSDSFCDSLAVNCNAPAVKWSWNASGSTVHFFDSTSSAISWNWDFGDGYLSILKDPVHEYTSEGNYYVCLSVQDTCGTGTYCDSVHACKLLTARFGKQPDGHSVQFSDSSNNALRWYWDFGDGFMSVLQNPMHYYQNFGNYHVCLTVTDSCESKTWCDSISVIPNAIRESSMEEILFYPDPVRNYMVIRSTRSINKNADLYIFNSAGEKVLYNMLFFTPGQAENRVSLDNLKPGLYFLRLVYGDKIINSKFVKIE